jgi:hypothetical protein
LIFHLHKYEGTKLWLAIGPKKDNTMF